MPKLRKLDIDTWKPHLSPSIRISTDLQQLSIATHAISMTNIELFLSQMRHLTYLTIFANVLRGDIVDGERWARLVNNIVTFKFSFLISNRECVNLNSFRTRFWLEEKKLYVTLDQWFDKTQVLLYSHPFFGFHRYPHPYIEQWCTSELTGPKLATFPHVTRLIVDDQLPFVKEPLKRFTHINSLVMRGHLSILLRYVSSCIDMSRITKFAEENRYTEIEDTQFARILHDLPNLHSLTVNINTVIVLCAHSWPHIFYLNIDYSFAPKSLALNEIPTLWRSFDHVQCFTFDRRCVHDLAKFLNCMTPTIFKLLIYQFGDLSNYDPPLITREWLELNTKLCHFDYSSNDYNTVHLWL
ncbi:unnamed protein product [Rotaria magnacalcarata]|uniref:Uncharacterized protein n=2 Tax=Rotaria magnacalcarata TaxID=392030 RepID=A0A816WQK9_9BILA|nr:unnamed protein product [Rotaria magnacalcarata]CAF3930470.1 unnamed protein product [Rotaria magnacalcarata]